MIIIYKEWWLKHNQLSVISAFKYFFYFGSSEIFTNICTAFYFVCLEKVYNRPHVNIDVHHTYILSTLLIIINEK